MVAAVVVRRKKKTMLTRLIFLVGDAHAIFLLVAVYGIAFIVCAVALTLECIERRWINCHCQCRCCHLDDESVYV